MGDKQQAKKKKRKKTAPASRWERRFELHSTGLRVSLWIAAILGGGVLGAGVVGQWFLDTRVPYAVWLVTAGAVITAGFILWGDKSSGAIRVGDAGLGFEKADGAIERIAWCDIRKLIVREGEVVIGTEDVTKSLPWKGHEKVIAWLVREAQERVPQVLEIDKERLKKLPETSDSDAERVKVEGIQVAGEKCRASGEVITFERDARWCPRCGAVYHKDHVPETCEVCSADLQAIR